MPSLGFKPYDFELFSIEGFDERMQLIYEHVRPRLLRLGDELAPALTSRLQTEFFPHVARHARRKVNPPSETWAAFGPSAKGYKRYPHLALCISAAGLHARVVVKSEAEGRAAMAHRIREQCGQLVRNFRGTGLGRYNEWDFKDPPQEVRADQELFETLAHGLEKKTGGLDVGFGWDVDESLRLDRSELLEAWRELEPLYRLLRSGP